MVGIIRYFPLILNCMNTAYSDTYLCMHISIKQSNICITQILATFNISLNNLVTVNGFTNNWCNQIILEWWWWYYNYTFPLGVCFTRCELDIMDQGANTNDACRDQIFKQKEQLTHTTVIHSAMFFPSKTCYHPEGRD